MVSQRTQPFLPTAAAGREAKEAAEQKARERAEQEEKKARKASKNFKLISFGALCCALHAMLCSLLCMLGSVLAPGCKWAHAWPGSVPTATNLPAFFNTAAAAGEEAEEEEQQGAAVAAKIRSAHDVLEDERLSKEAALEVDLAK